MNILHNGCSCEVLTDAWPEACPDTCAYCLQAGTHDRTCPTLVGMSSASAIGGAQQRETWHLTYDGPTALCGDGGSYHIHVTYAHRELDQGAWCAECEQILDEQESER